MSNYTIEIISVATPTGIKPFVTARDDYRTEERLAKEVPSYFKNERKLGDGYYFVNRVYFDTGLTKEQAEEGVAGLLALYNMLGKETLNGKTAPGKNRPKLELVEA